MTTPETRMPERRTAEEHAAAAENCRRVIQENHPDIPRLLNLARCYLDKCASEERMREALRQARGLFEEDEGIVSVIDAALSPTPADGERKS